MVTIPCLEILQISFFRDIVFIYHIVLKYNATIPNKQHYIYKGSGDRQISYVPVPIQSGKPYFILICRICLVHDYDIYKGIFCSGVFLL